MEKAGIVPALFPQSYGLPLRGREERRDDTSEEDTLVAHSYLMKKTKYNNNSQLRILS
jgi:hypothetical protein